MSELDPNLIANALDVFESENAMLAPEKSVRDRRLAAMEKALAAVTVSTALPQEPAPFPTAFCQPDDPDNSTAFSWPGTARSAKHTMALYAAPVASPLVGDDAVERMREIMLESSRQAGLWEDAHRELLNAVTACCDPENRVCGLHPGPERDELEAVISRHHTVHKKGGPFISAASIPTGVKDGPWCQPMQNGEHQPRTFMVYYEDQSVGVAVFDNEADAREHWQKTNTNWNCYLFGALPISPSPISGQTDLPVAGEKVAPAEIYAVLKEHFDYHGQQSGEYLAPLSRKIASLSHSAPERAVEALRKIAEVREHRHGSGVFDYKPALTAEQAQALAFETLSEKEVQKNG